MSDVVEKQYRVFKLDKKNGMFRTIYAPLGDYMIALKSAVRGIAEKMEKLDVEEYCHAFMQRRNCVTNAQRHIGYNYTYSMDLKDFFDSVTSDMLEGILSQDELDLCFIDGIARQGLPTSCACANLAFRKVDIAIVNKFAELGMQCVFTRYADDLCFSFDEVGYIEKLPNIIRTIVNVFGFEINENKNKLQKAVNGRIIITGVGVDSTGIYPTRKIMKKIRAAKHQNKTASIKGLLEWAKCKFPKDFKSNVGKVKKVKKSAFLEFCQSK